jgi:hypothetical protein
MNSWNLDHLKNHLLDQVHYTCQLGASSKARFSTRVFNYVPRSLGVTYSLEKTELFSPLQTLHENLCTCTVFGKSLDIIVSLYIGIYSTKI